MNTKTNNVTKAASAQPREGFVTIAGKVRAAEGAANDALRGALDYAIANGKFEPIELEAAGFASGTAKVYASEWNQAAMLADVIGKPRAAKLIRDAKALEATGEAKAYRAMLAVIRAAIAQAKAQGVQGPATGTQAAAIVKATTQACATRHANAAQKPAKGARGPNAATLAAATVDASTARVPASIAAGLRLLSNTAHGMPAPEGMDAEWQTLLNRLSDAVLAAGPFMKGSK